MANTKTKIIHRLDEELYAVICDYSDTSEAYLPTGESMPYLSRHREQMVAVKKYLDHKWFPDEPDWSSAQGGVRIARVRITEIAEGKGHGQRKKKCARIR